MTDILEEYDIDGDVSLDVDEKDVGGKRTEWLKFTGKGQTVRVGFVFFHTVAANAVADYVKTCRKAGEPVDKEAAKEAASASLAARAEELGKSVDELSEVDKLDLGRVNFKTLKAHYKDGLGYALSRLGKDGAEADEVWKQLGDPKTYFSTLLFKYPTDNEGNVNLDLLKQQLQKNKLDLIPWRFSKQTYDEVWKANTQLRSNDLSLASQDVLLECKEPKFQKISVTAAGKAAWQGNDKLREAVLRAAVSQYDKLVPFREMTTEQVREHLGLGGGGQSEDLSTTNFEDMLDGI